MCEKEWLETTMKVAKVLVIMSVICLTAIVAVQREEINSLRLQRNELRSASQVFINSVPNWDDTYGCTDEGNQLNVDAFGK